MFGLYYHHVSLWNIILGITELQHVSLLWYQVNEHTPTSQHLNVCTESSMILFSGSMPYWLMKVFQQFIKHYRGHLQD